jgi:SAM-dependent methyltransferase
MSASPELLTIRRSATRTLGPVPTLKELNLVCWGLFIAFLVLPLAFVSYTHHRSGEPLLKTGESDFVYLYGMGRLFNDHPAEELYDWAIQKKICTAIHPIQRGEYGPIPYHPFVGILFRPFAALPYIAALLLWISVSLVAYVVGVLVLSALYFRDNPLARSLILCFALSFYPFSWTMMAGHLSTLGFIAFAVALVQEHRGRPYLSGLALSVCIYKPTLLVLVLPMLLVTRRFKTCAGVATGSVALGLFATAVQGPGFWPGYFRMLFSFGRGAARVQTHTFKEVWKYVDGSSFLSSFVLRLPDAIYWIALPALLGFAVLAAGWLAWMWWKSESSQLVWAATLTWTLVLNVYVPIYDCLLVVIGAIVTAGVLRENPVSRLYGYFTLVWLLIFCSSWITTDVAETSGFQIITVFLAALGFIQLALMQKLPFRADGTASNRVVRATSDKQAWGVAVLRSLRDHRRALQDSIAHERGRWIADNRYYYDAIRRLLRFIVEPNKRVLELRCQTGHLLAAVEPAFGVGLDISEEMIGIARNNYPNIHFSCSEPEDADVGEKFDYVIVSHIFDTVDIQATLERVAAHCTPDTRVLVINYNQLWEPVLELASALGLRSPYVEPNWVSDEDVRGFLRLSGFRHLHTRRILLFPKYIPLISAFLNSVLAKVPLLRKLCLIQVIIARPEPVAGREEETSVSIIVPCRNEHGNVQVAVERIPEMGKHTEIIFCDDKSTDGTADEVRRLQALYPYKDIRLLAGPGICKAENVWTGFRAATGDVLMILDADLTVMPEELPFFFRALVRNRGEFVNGSRLVYPLPKTAMKFFNRLGNKIFGIVFSFLLDHRFKDTLCGTKALWRKDWLRIEKGLGTWGIRDLWGDYELIFGAAKLHLEIVEAPVHYQERIYGVTKMTRVFWNGVRMLGICRGAWRKLNG